MSKDAENRGFEEFGTKRTDNGCHIGNHRDVNPYSEGTCEFDEYRLGFNDARREYAE